VELRVGTASIVFLDSWTPNQRVIDIQRANREGRPVPESVHGTVVRSPRGTGIFELEYVPNGLADEGVRPIAARDRSAAVERLVTFSLETFEPLISKPFDRVSKTAEGIASAAYSILWKAKSGRTTLLVQRDWFLVAATEEDSPNPNLDLVLASYRATDSGGAAADIFDCEDMVRSIRIERDG
jgi:hypothetical protein